MYQLTVPYRVTTTQRWIHRHPRIPPTWNFEQVSSLLDTGRFAGATKMTVIDIDEPRDVVEAWMDTLRKAPVRARWDEGRLALRARARLDMGALREMRTERRRIARGHVRTREVAEVTRRTVMYLLPIVGIYGTAKLLGIDPDLMIAAFVPGTVLAEDHWSGTAGDDIEGRTPDTTLPSGATWVTKGGANAIEISSSGTPRITNSGVSAIAKDVAWVTGTSGADQFAEAHALEKNQGLVCVRLQGSGLFSGYGSRTNQSRIIRLTDPTTTTSLVQGTSHLGTKSIRLEIVGNQLSSFWGTTGSFPTPVPPQTTADDSTYSSGFVGLGMQALARTADTWRGGSLQPVIEAVDDFSDANGTELNGKATDTTDNWWTVNAGDGLLETQGGHCKGLTAATTAAWVWASMGGHRYAQADLATAGANRKSVGIGYEIDHAGTQGRGYTARYMSTTQINIYRNASSIASVTGLTAMVATDTIRLEMDRTGTDVELEVFVNGVSVLTHTDPIANDPGDHPAAVMLIEKIEEAWDNWDHGDVAAAGPTGIMIFRRRIGG